MGEKVDISNLDDASTYYGLGHSATKAEQIETCGTCGARYLVTDAGGHKCSPRFNVHDNPTLKDERWLEHNNRKLEAEARARGEELPEKDVATGTHTNAGAYAEIDGRVRELLANHDDLTFKEAVRIARQEVAIVLEPVQRKHGDDCGTDCPVCNRVTERTLRHGVASGGGGGSSGRRFKDQKKGTWTCPTCHLEYCEHRPRGSGRPSKENTARSVRETIRMTPETQATIEAHGISAPDALAIMGIALREGRPMDAVLTEWIIQYGPRPDSKVC